MITWPSCALSPAQPHHLPLSQHLPHRPEIAQLPSGSMAWACTCYIADRGFFTKNIIHTSGCGYILIHLMNKIILSCIERLNTLDFTPSQRMVQLVHHRIEHHGMFLEICLAFFIFLRCGGKGVSEGGMGGYGCGCRWVGRGGGGGRSGVAMGMQIWLGMEIGGR